MARLDPINVKYWKLAHSPNELGVETHADYACHCDICGDGKNPNSKRLHLFTKSNFEGDAVKCWNCGWTGNMWTYLKENHPSLYNQYRRDKQSESFNEILTIQNLNEPETNSQELPENVSLDFGGSLEVEPIPRPPEEPTPVLIDPLDIPSIKGYPEAIRYILNRGIEPKEDWLHCNGKVTFDGKELYLKDHIIVPLKWKDGRWYGFQALAYKKKDFRVVLLSDNFGWKVWNINFVNKEEPVYIFESIYDSLSSGIDNSIAQLGSSLHKDRIKELKEPIFCLDNTNIDEAAKRETLNYAKAGYKVFIWPKNIPNKFKDTNDLLKAGATKEQISKLIKNNIYEGMEAVLKLTL